MQKDRAKNSEFPHEIVMVLRVMPRILMLLITKKKVAQRCLYLYRHIEGKYFCVKIAKNKTEIPI